jgi:hypothetical protein
MIKHLTFLIVILLTTGCTDHDAIEPENFVGNWIVTEVSYDGNLLDEWTGNHLTINQNKIDGGLYSMEDTEYDSIWSSQGTWTKTNVKSQLILDDTETVDFLSDGNKLIIVKWLPSSADKCDPETEVCLPVVTGRWDFRFEREE